jgi:hypothetical protein
LIAIVRGSVQERGPAVKEARDEIAYDGIRLTVRA